MGSSGTGRRMTVSGSASINRTLSPGLRPIFFRKAAGMTTCPLDEVTTTGMDIHLRSVRLNEL